MSPLTATPKNQSSPLEGIRGRVRFSKAPWYDQVRSLHATVVGAGGIGSWLVHFLARAGATVTVWDMDHYDLNNMGGQLAHHEALDDNKAHAISAIVDGFLGTQEQPHVIPMDEAFSEESPAQPVTFAAVDDMNARKTLYEAWLALGEDREIFIDGRMGAEQFELYTATADHDNYLEHWFPPEEATALPCAYKATSHIGSMVASFMVGALTNYFSEAYVPEEMSFNTQLFMLDS